MLNAGYISFTKSKEIINILRCALFLDGAKTKLDHIVDTDIVNFFLKPLSSTILFKNKSKIVGNLPRSLIPYFAYLNIGCEIIRLEVPRWIAFDTEKFNLIVQIILDQCIKGQGYPVCLSEAHEQAVVEAADREFFYSLLYKITREQNQNYSVSQKSLKRDL